MTQFVIATAALNHDSKFAAAYTKGMKKAEYWQPTLEDSLDCVAKSFTVAARALRFVPPLNELRADVLTRAQASTTTSTLEDPPRSLPSRRTAIFRGTLPTRSVSETRLDSSM